jgi:hypothetical protein
MLDMSERERVRRALPMKLDEDWSAATGIPSN